MRRRRRRDLRARISLGGAHIPVSAPSCSANIPCGYNAEAAGALPSGMKGLFCAERRGIYLPRLPVPPIP